MTDFHKNINYFYYQKSLSFFNLHFYKRIQCVPYTYIHIQYIVYTIYCILYVYIYTFILYSFIYIDLNINLFFLFEEFSFQCI